MGTAAATQPTETHNNPFFNLLDNNQPRTSTIMHAPHNGTSPATPADLIEGIKQIMNQVTNDNKRDDASKKMMKNIKIFNPVGASGESLGARGKTKCEININRKIFYQTFIVCEHLKRPIILARDFSIQNCICISWTKTNTRRLTQNNKVIAETTEYQTPSRASVSLKKNIKVPP